jgi:hypothetical protein
MRDSGVRTLCNACGLQYLKKKTLGLTTNDPASKGPPTKKMKTDSTTTKSVSDKDTASS